MYTATGASRLSWKFVCEMPRRLKVVNSGDQAENCRPGTCCVISVVFLTPRFSSCSAENADIEMPTFCRFSSRFCAVTMISSICACARHGSSVASASGAMTSGRRTRIPEVIFWILPCRSDSWLVDKQSHWTESRGHHHPGDPPVLPAALRVPERARPPFGAVARRTPRLRHCTGREVGRRNDAGPFRAGDLRARLRDSAANRQRTDGRTQVNDAES